MIRTVEGALVGRVGSGRVASGVALREEPSAQADRSAGRLCMRELRVSRSLLLNLEVNRSRDEVMNKKISLYSTFDRGRLPLDDCRLAKDEVKPVEQHGRTKANLLRVGVSTMAGGFGKAAISVSMRTRRP